MFAPAAFAPPVTVQRRDFFDRLDESDFMPRYFIHLYNNQTIRDEVGQTLPDDFHARDAAVIGASEIIAENIARGELVDLRSRVEVENDDGVVTSIVKFSDLFTGFAN